MFRVTIKWLSQVSLFALEEALEGRTRQIPFDAIVVRILMFIRFIRISCRTTVFYLFVGYDYTREK